MSKKTDRFRFDLPTGWEDQTVYHFRGPDIDGQSHTMTLTIARRLIDDDIAAFARDRIDPIVENLQGLEVLKQEEVTLEGGHPVFEFVYRWIPGEGVKLYQEYVFVIMDGIGFSFCCSFSKKSFKMLGNQMKDMVEALLPGTYEPPEED